jgi:hypothetical protein
MLCHLQDRIQRIAFCRNARMYVFAFNGPDAHAFHSSCVHIPCIFNRHPRISSMKAAYMFMVEPLLAADKNFPERPLGGGVLCSSFGLV